jgi:hypothetical protein
MAWFMNDHGAILTGRVRWEIKVGEVAGKILLAASGGDGSGVTAFGTSAGAGQGTPLKGIMPSIGEKEFL